MNIYLLVEGRTEKKIYPKWISHLLSDFTRVQAFDEVDYQNYYLFSSGGYPGILSDIPKAAADINNCGKYSYFVVILDADESTVNERKDEVFEQIESCNLNAELIVVVQNRCFETWLLGNRSAYSRNPQNEILQSYTKFYNVSRKDPEAMPNFPDFNEIQQFHKDYLKRMLAEKGIRYTAANPREVGESYYIKELEKRTTETPGHLKTLKEFFSFCDSILKTMN